MLYKIIDIETDHSTAKLHTYFLDNSPEIDSRRKRPAVIICPGGGYEFTSDREAEPVAIRMNAMGFQACVLRYSVRPAVFPCALRELASTVALLRENADEWHIDQDKIIVAGFSAGGHLAACLGVYWHTRFITEITDIDIEMCRPNGLLLGYPVITSGEFAHRGSFKALLQDKEEDLLDQVSVEKLVTTETPPAFIWHTADDEDVPVENSMLFADALIRHKIPVELHIFPEGEHGLSLCTEETTSVNYDMIQPEAAVWVDMAGNWIRKL